MLQSASNCPSCGSGSSSLLFVGSDRCLRSPDKTYRVIECCECALIRLDHAPTESASPDPSAGSRRNVLPPPAQSRLARGIGSLKWSPLAAFVQRGLRDKGFVVDLSGGGLLAAALTARGVSVRDCNPGPPAGSGIHPSVGFPTVLSILETLRFAPDSLRMILAVHVLERECDPRAVLSGMGELLSPGASVVIQVPNADSWQALLLADRWTGFNIPRHPVSFDRESIEQLLKQCGFKVLRKAQFSTVASAMGLATSLCPWLDPDFRRLRGVQDLDAVRWAKDLLYSLLALAVVPLVWLESASGAGSVILIEACRDEVGSGEHHGRPIGQSA